MRSASRKEDVAAHLASDFPEIAPLLPRQRKFFRSQEARTDIFDALSLVVYACGLEAAA